MNIKRVYRLYFRGIKWRWFAARVRSRGCVLLSAASGFDRPIFVSGCQRSGTTLLTNLISSSPDIAVSHEGSDLELAGAYVLCGRKLPVNTGRYCFQTTYVNECYQEYTGVKSDFHIVWLLRNPESVVYSIVYNWARFPLNELFMSCGEPFLQNRDRDAFKRFGIMGLSPVKRACYAYIGKGRQFLELSQTVSGAQITSFEYEILLSNPQEVLKRLAQALSLRAPFRPSEKLLDLKSLSKARCLEISERETINSLCADIYRECQERSRYLMVDI